MRKMDRCDNLRNESLVCPNVGSFLVSRGEITLTFLEAMLVLSGCVFVCNGKYVVSKQNDVFA